MTQQQQQAATPDLLGIPTELRLAIIEDVLQSETDNTDHQLRFHDGILINAPTVLRVCKKLREEIGPSFFKAKIPTFKTFCELGMALLFSPDMADWCTSVRVEQCGSRAAASSPGSSAAVTPGAGIRQWELEPGLAMVARLRNLKHVFLGGASLELFGTHNIARAILLHHHPKIAHPAVVGPASPMHTLPRGRAWRREEVLMRDLCDVTWQIASALTEHHPTLETFEIHGELTEKTGFRGMRESQTVRARFRESCRMDAVNRKWMRELSVKEPLSK